METAVSTLTNEKGHLEAKVEEYVQKYKDINKNYNIQREELDQSLIQIE